MATDAAALERAQDKLEKFAPVRLVAIDFSTDLTAPGDSEFGGGW